MHDFRTWMSGAISAGCGILLGQFRFGEMVGMAIFFALVWGGVEGVAYLRRHLRWEG